MELTPAEELAAFVDVLKSKGVKSYKGEVPLGPGMNIPIDIVFERPERQRGDD